MLSAIFDPLTFTSMGVGLPKLITSLTRSPGSNDSRNWPDRAAIVSAGTPSSRQRSESQACSSLPRTSRSRAWNAPRVSPADSFRAILSVTSSGPPGHM